VAPKTFAGYNPPMPPLRPALVALLLIALSLAGCGGCDRRLTNGGVSHERCKLVSWPF